GTDLHAIDGTDARAIDGTDLHAIDGTDAQAIDGTDLLVVGRIEHVGQSFISVLGQSVFTQANGARLGDTVAVYGSIDRNTGSIVNARVVPARAELSYLRGIVDQVDRSLGRA